jgi:NIPSNAP
VAWPYSGKKEDVMLTLCIRYTLDSTKLADFETYARGVAGPIERCGGKVVGYFAPTKFAGPTNVGLSLIDFPSLAAYERYREALAADPEHGEVARRAAQSGVILVEDRSFVQRAS